LLTGWQKSVASKAKFRRQPFSVLSDTRRVALNGLRRQVSSNTKLGIHMSKREKNAKV